jgi:hypothetical protein
LVEPGTAGLLMGSVFAARGAETSESSRARTDSEAAERRKEKLMDAQPNEIFLNDH